MNATAMRAMPLAVLLIATSAASAPAGDEPKEKSEKKERTVIVNDDGVFTSEDGGPPVWRMPRHSRGFLGIRLLEMTPELRAHFGAPKDAGVLVASVESDSPAAKAGIQVGDIVTRADGERIESGHDLTHVVRGMKSGETLKIEVSRDRAVKQLAVKIEERPSAEIDLGDLGHDLGNLGRDISRDVQREIGRDFGRHAWVFRPESLDRLQEKLDQMDKRLKDLEKRIPAR